MPTLTEMFQPHLKGMFHKNAEFADNGKTTLRVTQSLPAAADEDGRRYARYIALHFEERVVDEYRKAVEMGDGIRQDRIGENVRRICSFRMEHYDPSGSQVDAFIIDIDGRALDE